jgi:hypothetical protein
VGHDRRVPVLCTGPQIDQPAFREIKGLAPNGAQERIVVLSEQHKQNQRLIAIPD